MASEKGPTVTGGIPEASASTPFSEGYRGIPQPHSTGKSPVCTGIHSCRREALGLGIELSHQSKNTSFSAEHLLQPFKRAGAPGPRPLRTTKERSLRMAGVRQTATRPELVVRNILRSLGVHYVTRNRNLPGSPDIANRSRKFAIFVHGCFWHRHRNCRMTTTPKRNRAFWESKFRMNIQRDRLAVHALRDLGFRVLIIWECQTRDSERLNSRIADFFKQSDY